MNPASRHDFSRFVSSAESLPWQSTPEPDAVPDLICLSHLRWNFVFQRPQQLMTRAARERRVFFVEEPVLDAAPGTQSVDVTQPFPNVYVVVPHLSASATEAATLEQQRAAVDELLRAFDVDDYVLWYWTPMPLSFTDHLSPRAVVFDCMDELSAFAGAPARLKQLEQRLLERADVVFTGGTSLYEAKRHLHRNVHRFPSSVDVDHFAQALKGGGEPDDQAALPRPRIGYFGVIDERMDLGLVAAVAERRPDWQLVLLGPIAKIDQASLPRRDNIHYLGMRPYEQLPQYLGGWDVAMLPFAHNDATRFVSPTKTPEYLAAGCAVVSTSIRDVARPYGELGLVHLADDADGFVAAIDRAMREDREARLQAVAACLAGQSWDLTWARMSALLARSCAPAREAARAQVGGHV